jgi:hypothetical protein
MLRGVRRPSCPKGVQPTSRPRKIARKPNGWRQWNVRRRSAPFAVPRIVTFKRLMLYAEFYQLSAASGNKELYELFVRPYVEDREAAFVGCWAGTEPGTVPTMSWSARPNIRTRK